MFYGRWIIKQYFPFVFVVSYFNFFFCNTSGVVLGPFVRCATQDAGATSSSNRHAFDFMRSNAWLNGSCLPFRHGYIFRFWQETDNWTLFMMMFSASFCLAWWCGATNNRKEVFVASIGIFVKIHIRYGRFYADNEYRAQNLLGWRFVSNVYVWIRMREATKLTSDAIFSYYFLLFCVASHPIRTSDSFSFPNCETIFLFMLKDNRPTGAINVRPIMWKKTLVHRILSRIALVILHVLSFCSKLAL